jgi:hypothetical protein
MTDTSQPIDRVNFTNTVESRGVCSTALANAVASCPIFVPETTALLLDLSPPTTYAQAAAAVLFRLANGVH